MAIFPSTNGWKPIFVGEYDVPTTGGFKTFTADFAFRILNAWLVKDDEAADADTNITIENYAGYEFLKLVTSTVVANSITNASISKIAAEVPQGPQFAAGDKWTIINDDTCGGKLFLLIEVL